MFGVPDLTTRPYERAVPLAARRTARVVLSDVRRDIMTDRSAVALLYDLTDAEDAADDAAIEGHEALVDALANADGFATLGANVARFDEKSPEEASAVHHTLGVFENVVDVGGEANALKICAPAAGLVTWLADRVAVGGPARTRLGGVRGERPRVPRGSSAAGRGVADRPAETSRRGADVPRGRGAAAAATWIARGDAAVPRGPPGGRGGRRRSFDGTARRPTGQDL